MLSLRTMVKNLVQDDGRRERAPVHGAQGKYSSEWRRVHGLHV